MSPAGWIAVVVLATLTVSAGLLVLRMQRQARKHEREALALREHAEAVAEQRAAADARDARAHLDEQRIAAGADAAADTDETVDHARREAHRLGGDPAGQLDAVRRLTGVGGA